MKCLQLRADGEADEDKIIAKLDNTIGNGGAVRKEARTIFRIHMVGDCCNVIVGRERRERVPQLDSSGDA